MMITKRELDNKLMQKMLKDAFFVVTEQPIMTMDNRIIRSYKAIVDRDTNSPISVVSKDYQLLTNERAFKIVDKAVETMFEGKTLADFEVYNVMMPKSKGSCIIDMVIPATEDYYFLDKWDNYTPFVRIANSYNRTLNFRFEIGFCRWICKNGCIFNSNSISISVSHTSRYFEDKIFMQLRNASARFKHIKEMWAELRALLQAAHNLAADRAMILPLYCKLFGVKIEENTSEQMKERYVSRAKHLLTIGDEYFGQLGDNLYAMFNVFTDFTTHPIVGDQFYAGRQMIIGKWLTDIVGEARKVGFSMEKYLENERRTAAALEKLIEDYRYEQERRFPPLWDIAIS